ncbi:hypothetical protein JCM10450v2_001708 [Rhodotorula kratochvilovae]
MPELPEVEAARKRLEAVAKGKRIKVVQTNEDSIVFSGTTHAHFATAIQGKTVKEVKRKGKNFYMILTSSPHPIFHFGMSGMAHCRGQPSPVYRVPRSASPAEEWPPKYMKACITFEDPEPGEESEWAFCDGRRLGRIKLVEAEEGEVEKVPPLSELGADPLLAMPSKEDFRFALVRRSAPIKAVLLDQNGPLSGIGNYMADEILYQSGIHPSVPASHFTEPEQVADLATLHAQIRSVTETAVAVDADAARFPADWLFQHRWGKGRKKKKGEEEGFVLPDGRTATISFITVGGRTSAVVDEVQVLPPEFRSRAPGKKRAAVVSGPSTGADERKKRGKAVEDEEGLKEEADDNEPREAKETSPHFKRALKKEESPLPSKRRRKGKAKEETSA